MATERELVEIAARCVSTMVFYHNSERTLGTAGEFSAEVRQIALIVQELGLRAGDVEGRIIRPFENDLIDRHGHEVGPRLLGEFMTAFEGRGGRDLVPGL